MILVVNSGSSSIKIELFDPDLVSCQSGAVTEIGGTARIELDNDRRDIEAPDHESALGHLLDALAEQGHTTDKLTAAAHRIVHGGASLTAPARLTPEIVARIAANNALAPLHNPHNLSAVHALSVLAPDLPQFASFDTAFHADNPDIATTYPIPQEDRDAGIRRYGFHGISYAGLVQALRPDLPRRLLALHLGNGASLCAILDGRSVATSMGYSPLEGLVMGTRTGSIDGMAVLRLAEAHGINGAARRLNQDSGLTALAGTNDMATILKRDDEAARFAVDHFCYWAARHAGSAIVAMGGMDAIAFTGGIGENAPAIRARIANWLAWTGLQIDATANRTGQCRFHADGSPVEALTIPADEERMIAADALTLLRG